MERGNNLSWALLLSAPQKCQQQGDQQHGRDQEPLRSENQKTDQGAQKSRQGGYVITCGQPLLRKGSDEKGCHGKLNSRGGKGKHRPSRLPSTLPVTQ